MNWQDFAATCCSFILLAFYSSRLIEHILRDTLVFIILFDTETASEGHGRLRADIRLVVVERLPAIPVALTAISNLINNLTTESIRMLGCVFTSPKRTIRQTSQYPALGLLIAFFACTRKQRHMSDLMCLILFVASRVGRAINLLKPKGGMMSLSRCLLVKPHVLRTRAKAVCVGQWHALGPILCFSAPPGWRTETCQAGTGVSFVTG